eukprot:313930-Pelagomonas_calceolata.AAC.2
MHIGWMCCTSSCFFSEGKPFLRVLSMSSWFFFGRQALLVCVEHEQLGFFGRQALLACVEHEQLVFFSEGKPFLRVLSMSSWVFFGRQALLACVEHQPSLSQGAAVAATHEGQTMVVCGSRPLMATHKEQAMLVCNRITRGGCP